jgi:hypothetical protein
MMEIMMSENNIGKPKQTSCNNSRQMVQMGPFSATGAFPLVPGKVTMGSGEVWNVK